MSFGDDIYPAPFTKNSDGFNIGQIYLSWKPYPCLETIFCWVKMSQPLYTTTMVWDSDFSPEGIVERFKLPAWGRL